MGIWRQSVLNGLMAAWLLCSALGGPAAAAGGGCLDETVDVVAVATLDARTLGLSDGRVLRLAGIEPFDLLAVNDEDAETRMRERLEQMDGALPLSVQLSAQAADRYGRHPALVVADGTLVQEMLVREGLVIAYAGGDSLPCFDRLLAAEDAARRAGRGGWAGLSIPNATPRALKPWIGGFAIFEGRVLSVGNRRARTYLNFGERWSEDVTVEIEARHRKFFGGEEGLAALSGKRVRVRGFLEEKSGPMMIVRSPMQLEVLGDNPGKIGEAP